MGGGRGLFNCQTEAPGSDSKVEGEKPNFLQVMGRQTKFIVYRVVNGKKRVKIIDSVFPITDR